MSTRGLYGIRKNGTDKTTYNHCDSYPDYLGMKVLEFCKNHDISKLSKIFDNIIMVNEPDKPSKEQIKHIFKIEGSEPGPEDYKADWYWALRSLQGNLSYLADAMDLEVPAYMTEGSNFIKDSVSCQYAYIINVDTGILEFYKGSETRYNPANRYSENKRGDYPCRLALEIPLLEIFNASDDNLKHIIKIMNS